MSQLEAITGLFVAFGAHRNTEQAQLYLAELSAAVSCPDCAEAACESLMRRSKRLPSLADLLEEGDTQLRSERHAHHIASPQLAPRAETWWRAEATKIIGPKVDGDRDLAALIAAQMWFSSVEQDLDAIAWELEHYPIWIDSARSLVGEADPGPIVAAAFARARWAVEHDTLDEMPAALLNLEVSA